MNWRRVLEILAYIIIALLFFAVLVSVHFNTGHK